MLLSLALIFILGLILSGLFHRIRLPGLLGMMMTGIILGPFGLNAISSDIMHLSADLREIALIVILLRAGLSLDLDDLKIVGRPAVLLSFLPATLEMLAIIILAPWLFGIGYLEAALMGSVVAAVSPAVVVPRMISLMEYGYGQDKRIPTLIMAGSSLDDVYVIVWFSVFLGMLQGQGFEAAQWLRVPFAIVFGFLAGLVISRWLIAFFQRIHIRDTVKVLILLSISFVLVSLEDLLPSVIPFSGLLAVMTLGGGILKYYPILAKRIMGKFGKIWVAAEILLFVLVGTAVNLSVLAEASMLSLVLLLGALSFRIIGVFLSLYKTALLPKEKLFCAIAYLPKATVQAAIGTIPLTLGLASGQIILSVAVLSIMVAAPLGAIGIDKTFEHLLSHPQDSA